MEVHRSEANTSFYNDHHEADIYEQQPPRVASNCRIVKSVKIKVDNTSFFEVFKSTFEHTVKQLKILGKETLIKGLIGTLWRTLFPAAPENQEDAAQDSFEVFLIMLLEAESKNERRSENAMHMLINYSGQPFVSNIAVRYLKTTFKEHVDVISFPITDVSDRTENHTDSIPETFSEQHQTISSKLHKITCFLLLSFKKRFIIFFMILLLILLLVVLTYLIRHLKTSQEESVGTSTNQPYKISNNVSTTEVAPDQTKFNEIQNFKDKRNKVSDMQVTSYKDLMNKLPNVTSAAPIFLKIISDSAGLWANEENYGDCSKIEQVEVGGKINILDVRQILIKMDHVHKVVLKNDENSLCNLSEHTVQELITKTIKNISWMVLKKLTACSKVYQVLSDSMLMTEIREFVMDECIIEDENSLYIQAMLHNSRDTLESIEFSRTVFRSSIINHKLRTFGELRSLKMDILNVKNGRNIVYLPRQIYHIFPFLEIFNSSSGYFQLDEFKSLTQCDKLKSIQIGLHVFGNPSKFEVGVLFKNIPLVTHVKLALKFPESKFDHDCKLFGLVDLKKRIDILEIRSNCSIEN